MAKQRRYWSMPSANSSHPKRAMLRSAASTRLSDNGTNEFSIRTSMPLAAARIPCKNNSAMMSEQRGETESWTSDLFSAYGASIAKERGIARTNYSPALFLMFGGESISNGQSPSCTGGRTRNGCAHSQRSTDLLSLSRRRRQTRKSSGTVAQARRTGTRRDGVDGEPRCRRLVSHWFTDRENNHGVATDRGRCRRHLSPHLVPLSHSNDQPRRVTILRSGTQGVRSRPFLWSLRLARPLCQLLLSPSRHSLRGRTHGDVSADRPKRSAEGRVASQHRYCVLAKRQQDYSDF